VDWRIVDMLISRLYVIGMPGATAKESASSEVLSDLRADLKRLYGARIACMVLFGSCARGDARSDSDYDVAVFTHGMDDRWAEFDRIDPIVSRLLVRGAGVAVR
jgi:predicted nucleotidyltransferase